jgi:DNA-binding transcriptional LysR family regulator
LRAHRCATSTISTTSFKAVDHGSFSRAAEVLGVAKSKLSRRIARLEERLGVRLIQRSTRKFSVTELGQDFYRHALAMVVEADAAHEVIERTKSAPQGVVRVSCPNALLYFRVADMLARYMAANPLVQVQLEGVDRPVDVIGEGFDIALRVRFPPLEDSGLAMRALSDSSQRLVASPALLAGFPGRAGTGRSGFALPSADWGPAGREHVWRLRGAEMALRRRCSTVRVWSPTTRWPCGPPPSAASRWRSCRPC